MGFKSDLSKHMSYIFLLENLATADLLCVCHWLPSSTANLDLNECHMSFARFFFRGWRMHERHADNQDQNSPTFLGCRREFSHFSQKQLMKNVSGLPAKISCKILIALRRDGLNPDHVTSFVTWKLIHLFECIRVRPCFNSSNNNFRNHAIALLFNRWLVFRSTTCPFPQFV